MDNVVLVDTPSQWPSCCITCGSQRGPLADTGVERNGERIYACKRCVMTFARVFGFVKGEKMEELSRAVDELAARDRQIAAHEDALVKLRTQFSEACQRGEALSTLLEQERAKGLVQANLIGQLHDPLRQLAETVNA